MMRSNSAQPEYDFDYVAARLAQAGMTLLALQVKGLRPAGFRSNMPEPVGTVADDRRVAPPPPKRVTEMDQALSWVTLIPADKLAMRRLIQARSLTSPRSGKPIYSWKELARWLGCSDHTAKTWWIAAVGLIVARLNAPGLCAQPQFRDTRRALIGALENAANRAALAPIDKIRALQSA